MKLKNTFKDVRQLLDNGQVVMVQPGEVVDVINPRYDDRVFVPVNTKKRKDELNNEKEVKE